MVDVDDQVIYRLAMSETNLIDTIEEHDQNMIQLLDHRYARRSGNDEIDVEDNQLEHVVKTEPQGQHHKIKTEEVYIKEERYSPSAQTDDKHQHNLNNDIEEINIKEERRSPSLPAANYQCAICHKHFVVMNNLKLHVDYMHGRNRSYYNCDICHQQILWRDLAVHMRVHAGEKSYECHICHKQQTTKGNLTMHIRTHTGEKPYNCNICHQKFSQKGHLIQHIRRHTGEKRYECDICRKQFAVNSSLTRHTRTHT